jgi:transaldolase/glucose-6-phosphate isomerase
VNALRRLLEHGQSPWYDNIRRSLIASGELARMVEEDGLRGVTSNPSIFAKAITGSTDYDEAITTIRRRGSASAEEAYEELAIADIQGAADVLRPVYDATGGGDGFVSLEVSPHLAHDTAGSVGEAERLWNRVGRPNVMVKIPATREGLPAIRIAISRGVNINVTLLFARSVWEQVAEAYIAGLEDLAAAGGDPASISSVASFFVSRIDTAVDAQLDARDDPEARRLRGRVAIANAKLTYARWREVFAAPRFAALAERGARPQRLLWASTSTKDPAYPETMYVEELIGPETIDTIPPATWEAFRDHGRVAETLTRNPDEAERVLGSLSGLGIDLDEATARVLEEGLEKFVGPFDDLLATVADELRAGSAPPAARTRLDLPGALAATVEGLVGDWGSEDKVRRLWSRDASLWTGDGESNWLGWLGVAERELEHVDQLEHYARDAFEAGFTHALLLGMGGSSLAPEMFARTFGGVARALELHVLDSTDPEQVREVEASLPLGSTLFIVSSKSGSTLEPNILARYFEARVSGTVGPDEVGRRFAAVTDPGSDLERLAREHRYRWIAHGVPSIGGRYSALSNFGLVPAAIVGADVPALLGRAAEMAHACSPHVAPGENPGLILGAALGAAALAGRDKVTLVAPRGIADLAAWLEQLLAESTGKHGRGVIPVAREPLGAPEAYGDDRLFVQVRLESEPDAQQDSSVDALAAAGHPVIRIGLRDALDLGGEIFRWELATAVVGAVLDINPFDQPDVEASKQATRALTAEYERSGELPAERPLLERDGVSVFADERKRAALDGADSLPALLRSHLARAAPGDYVALLAFVPRVVAHERALAVLRATIRDRTGLATVDGFGPRFLHSTGQAYKGGPNSGVFFQVTAEHREDLPVPGARYTMGVVEAAQARGDLSVLEQRERRAVRLHLTDVDAGLGTLQRAIEEAI